LQPTGAKSKFAVQPQAATEFLGTKNTNSYFSSRNPGDRLMSN